MLKQHRPLAAVSIAHAIQDGLVALQFVLLPVLASSLGLTYAQVGLLKAIGNTAIALLEIPSALLAEKVGERALLGAGLLTAGAGYAAVSSSSTFGWVAIGLLFAGCGAGFQHSLSSSLLVKHYHGAQRRRSLGIYNAFGDVGKLSFTALFGLLIGIGLAWDHVVMLLALTALVSAAIVFRMLPPTAAHSPDQSPSEPASTKGWGIRKPFYFGIVATVSLLDGIVQAVFLTFIAFVMLNKGASAATASLAVVLTLAGGMVGKFAGGFLAAQLGDRMAFQLLQAMTIAGLLAVIGMPATILIMLLPLIGVAVQGSSTIYYGCVADCAEPDKQSRAYSLVYTLANGSSVVGPLVLGAIADHFGLDSVMWSLIALTALTMVLGIGFGSRHDDTA